MLIVVDISTFADMLEPMNHYIPLFSKIVDSSLWDEPDTVIKVFLSMLAKKEKGDIVIASAYAISRWARKTEAETLEALKTLSSPDTRRLEPQPFEGRRIEKVEGGWRILNGAFYQKEMQKLNRREYNRNKQAEHRARQQKDPIERHTAEQVKTGFSTIAKAMQQSVPHGTSLTEPTDEFISSTPFPLGAGSPESPPDGP